MRPRSALEPYVLMAPTALLLAVFFFYPLGFAAHQSLYEWDLLTPPRFVGLPIEQGRVISLAEDLDHQRALAVEEVDPSDPFFVADVDLPAKGGHSSFHHDLVEPVFQI